MFDPYYKWLGIPPTEQPPNLYRLLGLTLFEDDSSVIETAADQRLLYLRTFQSSRENGLAERLLNEVTSAKLCLLRPDRKLQYDTKLRSTQHGPAAPPVARQLTPSPLSADVPPYISMAPVAAPPVFEQRPEPAPAVHPAYDPLVPSDEYVLPVERRACPTTRQDKATLSPFIIAGPLVGIAAVAIAIVSFNSRDDDQEVATHHSAVHAGVSSHTAPIPPKALSRPAQRFPSREPLRLPGTDETSPQQLSSSAGQPQWAARFIDDLLAPITHGAPDTISGLGLFTAAISEFKATALSRWIPSTKIAPPISLTFEQNVVRIDGRDIPNDEQLVAVPIGFIPPSAELRISASTYLDGPGTKLVLQKQPEPIVINLSVNRGKPGFATVHVKPWLGPPGATLGIPCSLPRLNALVAGLPAMIDNAQSAAQATQQQIQNLENTLSAVANATTTNLGEKTANQQTMQTIRAHLNTQYAKLHAIQNSISTMQARLSELPGIITQVQTLVGTAVQFQILYKSGKQDVMVAKSE